MMKKATPKTKEIIFLREFRKVLQEMPAELVGESKPWCAVCHESEVGHDRGGRRKHAFVPETGSTISVHYPSQEFPVTYHHVMQGKTANHWKEKQS